MVPTGQLLPDSAIENKGRSYVPRPSYGSKRGKVMGIVTCAVIGPVPLPRWQRYAALILFAIEEVSSELGGSQLVEKMNNDVDCAPDGSR